MCRVRSWFRLNEVVQPGWMQRKGRVGGGGVVESGVGVGGSVGFVGVGVSGDDSSPLPFASILCVGVGG